MGYSKKRMFVIGALWLCVGLLLFGGSLITGTTAQNAQPPACGDNGPCSFPADNYDGGIVLGTPQLDGTSLALFDEQTANANANGIDPAYPRDVMTADTLATGAASDEADISTVGFNVDTVDNLFLYKTWKTTVDRDVPTQSEVDNRNYDDVYVYVQTSEAQLDGPDGDVSGVECRESDSNNQFNPNDCDLIAEISEVSFVDIEFTGNADVNVPIDGTVTEEGLEGIDGSPNNGFWLTRPQEDVCGAGDIVDLAGSIGSFSVSIDSFCLGVVDVTFEDQEASDLICILEQCVSLQGFTIEELQLYDLMVRSHGYVAEPPGDPNDPSLNKVLTLGDPNTDARGFYAEIRWGKGHDRARFPPSTRAAGGTTSNPSGGENHRFGGPIGASFDDTSDGPGTVGPDAAGLANTFPCEGNPTDTGDDDCDRRARNSGSPRPGPYDDIER